MATIAQHVICGECKQQFNTAENSFVRRSAELPDIEESGLICPHCNHEIIAYQTNSEIRRLQAAVRKQREQFRKRIAAGMAPDLAEKGLKRSRKRLERAFKRLNPQVQ